MNALSFMEILKNDGVNLSVVGENRLVATPASRLTDSHRVALKAHKAAILSALANPPLARSEQERFSKVDPVLTKSARGMLLRRLVVSAFFTSSVSVVFLAIVLKRMGRIARPWKFLVSF